MEKSQFNLDHEYKFMRLVLFGASTKENVHFRITESGSLSFSAAIKVKVAAFSYVNFVWMGKL